MVLPHEDFQYRHIGPNAKDQKDMLSTLGYSTLADLLDAALPEAIRFEGDSANAKAVFAGVGAQAGRNVALQLAFARAGVVTVNVIIRDKRDDYAGVTP